MFFQGMPSDMLSPFIFIKPSETHWNATQSLKKYALYQLSLERGYKTLINSNCFYEGAQCLGTGMGGRIFTFFHFRNVGYVNLSSKLDWQTAIHKPNLAHCLLKVLLERLHAICLHTGYGLLSLCTGRVQSSKQLHTLHT